ncbi:hypothetical protein PQU63_09260 [Xanthomonas protegens]|uniref:DUF4410 domain-containing protein n=1 Tax=Xanthomonas protegens TaxID=3380705 RepID=A0ABU9LE87_9XANT
MKLQWKTLALVSVMLLAAGCATNSVVHQSYKATTAETYWYQLTGNDDTDADSLAMFRRQLDTQLDAAHLHGAQGQANARKMTIVIDHYYMRSNGARFWAGIMAGRDKIKSRVTVADANGKTAAQFDVESTNSTAWGTSEGLIERHAQEIVARLKQLQ